MLTGARCEARRSRRLRLGRAGRKLEILACPHCSREIADGAADEACAEV